MGLFTNLRGVTMVLMLMRHPHTLANQEKTFPKENLSPYSIRGEKEYQESLNKDYPVKRILTSPYKRALTLAEGISEKKGIPMDVVDALKEVDMGLFGGLTFEEVKLKFPEETKVWLEDPESFTGGAAGAQGVAGTDEVTATDDVTDKR